MAQSSDNQTRFLPSLLIGGLSAYTLQNSGPILIDNEINALPASAAFFCGISALAFTADAFKIAADFVDWCAALKTTGLKGTAGFIKNLQELGNDFKRSGWGPYWGAWRSKTEIIAPYESIALTCGTSGSGKSSGVVIPTALSITDSKCLTDFKGSLTCQLVKPLRKRGETVRILNYAQVNEDILGPSDTYNPMCILTDCFKRPGGLLEFGEINDEKSLQIYPEPSGQNGQSENSYFRNGSRFLISWANQTNCLILGEQATLGDSVQMLNDRASLLRHALWACGRLPVERPNIDTQNPTIAELFKDNQEEFARMPLEDSPWVEADIHEPDDIENFITHYRSMSERVVHLLSAADARTADPFLEGAQQAMSKFGIATRAHKISASSSFRFEDMKGTVNPTNVFIIADANAIAAQGPLIAHIQWCMMQELKRHANKHRPVYLIADEASNFKLHELGSLMTWARGYGVRIHLFLQNFSAFREAYSKETLKTLLSEAEIQQYLPQTREQEVLDFLEKKLGQKSVIVRSRRGNRSKGGVGIDGMDYREEGRPLLTADEIRREKRAILFVKNHKPALVEIIPFSAIAPWRNQIGIDPFHAKRWLKPIKLRITRRQPQFKSQSKGKTTK